MDYWEKANHSWFEDSKRVILTPTQRSRNLFFYIIICQIKRDKTFHIRNSKKHLMEFGNLLSF
ncbi:hypothetical protein ACFCWA_05065, partial [Enterococcus faecium]|uniref:hypothetical protein n=1 Tax=Enterococcus faecium TaxID=1352 RepID=UPI0035DF0FC4